MSLPPIVFLISVLVGLAVAGTFCLGQIAVIYRRSQARKRQNAAWSSFNPWEVTHRVIRLKMEPFLELALVYGWLAWSMICMCYPTLTSK